MMPSTPAPRWSARVDRSDWESLTASATARGVRVEDLIADMLVELSPADLTTPVPQGLVSVRAALPEHVRVEIRERAYLARVRVADVIHAPAVRVRSAGCVPV
ncbi:hypothetical protein [Corynebacterium silvaticum]|uniref:Uncharacterized protein n=1 Tax=Corynebacterium silvaticum TaxID=2320431 RepID=A0A7U5HLD3_9CORY|nr:hypothetical protein [Corynebacterium silvaticum]ARU45890.1 hypothetical protein CBE74_04575 [Corynebacterium silvaticum]NOM64641.1 hypothetical protein [Corynebacterium silvaticum]TFA93286.1 hypothetical protein EU802_03770 [Corynebacterium silvaticum]TFA96697.1 hypothetical protein EU799_03890 [Corynebacterium silvaticum]TNX85047.1 hypothetical protein FIT55_03955 [Corynebacterium silvaticum]